jgi:hypothetical protein
MSEWAKGYWEGVATGALFGGMFGAFIVALLSK